MSAPRLGLTRAAAENVVECGIDPLDDIAALRDGRHTRESLLAHCLDGADDDRVQGWHEYVDRVVDLAADEAARQVRARP